MNSDTSPLSTGLTNPIAAVRRFFHTEEIPFGLALVRIVLPWALFAAHARRWFFTRELYSTDGAPSPLWISYGYPDLLPLFNGEVMVALHTALLFFLLASSLGWCTRISLLCSTVLFCYTNIVDCVSTITKYSCIGTHALLILSMSRCGDVWSIDAWRKGTARRSLVWPGEPRAAWPSSSMWARRLLQLCLVFVYFGAGVTKLKTSGFFTGDQLVSWMLSNVNFQCFLGKLMAMYPAWLIVLGYGTVVWEVVFPFLCWRGWGRIWMLGIGLVFHFFTLTMLGLTIFPAVCTSFYFAFLDERDYRLIAATFRRFARRHRTLASRLARLRPRWDAPKGAWLPAPAALLITASVLAGTGVALEHWIDPYGVRRPEGRYALTPMDPARAAELLAPAPPLKEKDVFFSLDVGSFMAGGVLANQKSDFRPNEKILTQVYAAAPHADLYVSVNLHDADDRVVRRKATILPREHSRGNFDHLTTGLTPGTYYLVLLNAGTEITRRKVEILSEKGAGARAPLAQ